MLGPLVMGADQTTVSVATGNTEFHPLYFGLLNPSNQMRRAHRDTMLPVAFLAIPKGAPTDTRPKIAILSRLLSVAREDENTDEFRLFKKLLYHGSIAHILKPLRPTMTTPEVIMCPDGHYRRAIYEIGSFMPITPNRLSWPALCKDGVRSTLRLPFRPVVYSQQAFRCRAPPDKLESLFPDSPRSRGYTDIAHEHLDDTYLWDKHGAAHTVMVRRFH